MRPLLSLVAVASVAYLATMMDNLVAFAAQLALAPRDQHRTLAQWQSAAVAVLAAVAVFLGSLLRVVPLAFFAIFALAPWWLGWHAWRQRHTPSDAPSARKSFTVFAVTLALGGDNVAVWAPLVRLDGILGLLTTVLTFAWWQLLFIVVARGLANHPALRTRVDTMGRQVTPWLYGLLGVVILAECLPL